MEFSASLATLFQDVDIRHRFQECQDAGFSGAELQMSGIDKNVETLVEIAKKSGLEIVLLNQSTGDLEHGMYGLSGVPGREDQFRDEARRAFATAVRFECRNVNIGPSRIPAGASRAECERVLQENVNWAADLFKEMDVRVLLEPINSCDHPDMLVTNTAQALEIISSSNRQNVGLQFDVYHAWKSNENIEHVIGTNGHSLMHIQLADFPDRHEPGTGILDFKKILRDLCQAEYSGYVGMEYYPSRSTRESLGWMSDFKNICQ